VSLAGNLAKLKGIGANLQQKVTALGNEGKLPFSRPKAETPAPRYVGQMLSALTGGGQEVQASTTQIGIDRSRR